MPISGEVEVITISCVPERSDCVACRSPPSAPPQNAWIFILPPDFSSVHAFILATPLPTGCSWLMPFDMRIVRSVNWACAGMREDCRGDAGGKNAGAEFHLGFS